MGKYRFLFGFWYHDRQIDKMILVKRLNVVCCTPKQAEIISCIFDAMTKGKLPEGVSFGYDYYDFTKENKN